MSYTQSAIDSLAQLYSSLTGLDLSVAKAQVTAEQGVNGNVLGLTVKNGATNVYTGQTGVFQASNGQWLATFASPQAGVEAAAAWLKNPNSPYAAVRAAIATGNPTIQAHALASSGWAGTGGYLHSSAFASLLSASPGPSASPSASGSGSLASSVATFLGLSPSAPLTEQVAQQAAAKYAQQQTGATGGRSYSAMATGIYTQLQGWLGKALGQVPFNTPPSVTQATVPTGPEAAAGPSANIPTISLDVGGAIAALPGELVSALAPVLVALIVLVIIAWLALSGVRELEPA